MKLSLLNFKVLRQSQPVSETKPDEKWSPKRSWLILGLLCLLFISTSATPWIFNDNEGLYAGAVREMTHSGNWLEPTNNGFLRVQKPPLLYWILLTSTSIFGLNEFGLRLPTALTISAWVIAVYQLMRRISGERFGITAALILATFLGLPVFARELQPEPFLALFCTLALLCAVEARFARELEATGAKPRFSASSWYQLVWVFTALGSLSKGLQGLFWPLGGMALTALCFRHTRSWLRGVISLRGILLFFLIFSPWYIYMGVRWPGFLAEHFLNEQVRASVTERAPQLYPRWYPLHIFFLHQIFATLPWSLALPAAFFSMRNFLHRLTPVARDAVACIVMTFVWEMISLTFSMRQTYYGVSSWGLAAGFLAIPWLDDSRKNPTVRALITLPLLAVLAAGACYVFLSCHYALHAPATPADLTVRKSYFMAVFTCPPMLSKVPVAWTAAYSAALLAGGSAAGWFWLRRNFFAAMLALAGSMAAVRLLAVLGITQIASYFSFAKVSQIIDRSAHSVPSALVVYDGNPVNASSFLFYLHTPIHYVDADMHNEYAQRVLGLGKDYYMKEDQFSKLWNSPRPVYFVVNVERTDYWKHFFKKSPPELFVGGHCAVFTNFAAPAPVPAD